MHRPVSIVYPPPVWVYPAVVSVFCRADLVNSQNWTNCRLQRKDGNGYGRYADSRRTASDPSHRLSANHSEKPLNGSMSAAWPDRKTKSKPP